MVANLAYAAPNKATNHETDYEKDLRLSFLEIDESTKRYLRKFRPVLSRHLPQVLDGFYRHLGQISKLRQLVGGDSNIARLKEAQTQHWLNLFNAEFNEGYMAQVQLIGQAHERIGLEPRWYLGGYCYALTRLLGLTVKTYWMSPKTLSGTLRAITKAIFMDLELAITVYNQSIRSSAGKRLEAAVEEINRNVNVVAASIEEMSASMNEISHNTAQGAQISNKLKTVAETTQHQVGILGDSTQEIAHVIDLISGIAAQTNLLALNATIEAASAGEAGRGFAVVANEVKELAKQSGQASEDIRMKIGSMLTNMESSVQAIQEITSVVQEMNILNNSIASAVEEQSAVSNEINRSILNVVNASENMVKSF